MQPSKHFSVPGVCKFLKRKRDVFCIEKLDVTAARVLHAKYFFVWLFWAANGTVTTFKKVIVIVFLSWIMFSNGLKSRKDPKVLKQTQNTFYMFLVVELCYTGH